MTPLEILANKLTDPEITEAQRQLAIEEIGQEIRIYCNREDVPVDLRFVWANMAADLLRYEQEENRAPDEESGEADLAGKVSAISEGDTSVSFGNKSVAEADRERQLGERRTMLDALILNYREQLQRHRKVRR